MTLAEKLTEKTGEIIEQSKDLMNSCVGQVGLDAFKYASSEELELMQKALKLYDDAMSLAVIQAELIKEQDEKLNKIIKLLETRA